MRALAPWVNLVSAAACAAVAPHLDGWRAAIVGTLAIVNAVFFVGRMLANEERRS